MLVISGMEVAARLEAGLKAESDRLRQAGCRPTLAVVQVGDNPASSTYVRNKLKAAERLGIAAQELKLQETASQAQVEAAVEALNADPVVHGLLVQLPLPAGLDGRGVTQRIDPRKDVDGLTPLNAGLLAQGTPRFVPCTPAGVLELLAYHRIPVAGRMAVILGRSNIVGRPLSILLSSPGWDATVLLCHSRTPNLAALTRQADILIAAIGKPEFVTGDMVREGAVVIDVGVNRVPDVSRPRGYRICGDVHYPSVAPKSQAITPVPGGVGPMTVTLLMRNTLLAARGLHGAAGGFTLAPK
jgi:methylenetetrahydrofolate dehydrogenase (NADP+)/methenyltetrahydrofolate cyclohydrolase